jgi:hypothetical protein
MRRIIFVSVVAAAVLTALPIVQFGPLRPSIAVAHAPGGAPTVHPPSPPTYDYDTVTPGTQPPTSPLLAGSTARIMETLALSVFATVPQAELQAVLPGGFIATESPAGSGLAVITLRFRFQERIEQLGGGTFGPASGLVVFHIARNAALNRPELLILAAEFSDASLVNGWRAVFGPGSSRLADVEVEIKEKGEQLQLKFDVEDEAIGLSVKVQAEGPAAITRRTHSDPFDLPLRPLNDGIFANPAHRSSNMGDVQIVEANLELHAAGGQLRLPGGVLTIAGLAPNVAFVRAFESLFRPESQD